MPHRQLLTHPLNLYRIVIAKQPRHQKLAGIGFRQSQQIGGFQFEMRQTFAQHFGCGCFTHSSFLLQLFRALPLFQQCVADCGSVSRRPPSRLQHGSGYGLRPLRERLSVRDRGGLFKTGWICHGGCRTCLPGACPGQAGAQP